MADEKLLALLKQDVDAWNEWRKDNPDVLRPDLREADLSEANLVRDEYIGNMRITTAADLSGADLSSANLSNANLSWADLSEASLSGANLYSAGLIRVNLSGANLNGADLHGADLSEADLSWANLRDADLHRADLREAKLKEANLKGANLSEADLRAAQISLADLRYANLNGADLSDAKLRWGILVEAKLVAASLIGADLRFTDLGGANLIGADLSGADLRQARLADTILGDVNLRGAKNLDTCLHLGPCIIDHRTLQQSGSLPLSFLRGCGLPDNLIDYLPSLLNQPIQFYSCFLSHSSKDGEFARHLYADLQDKGGRCWFAPEDLKVGDRIRDTIDRIIRVRDKLLVVLSENSIASQWVEDEVEAALEEERKRTDRRTILFPVRIDDAVLHTDRSWARAIMRTRHIGDFSRWKEHGAYRKSFERLLRDLKPELERKPGQES
jgi:uncharacterized protein YjbI with pentapeptide repeats